MFIDYDVCSVLFCAMLVAQLSVLFVYACKGPTLECCRVAFLLLNDIPHVDKWIFIVS